MIISIIHTMNLQTLDLNLLLVFEALMDERNVTRASKLIGLSQPAMSNALSRLRRIFDDPLLERKPGGMTPTPRALALVVPVRGALAQLRAALEATPAFDPAVSNRTFHILANDYVDTLLLPSLIARVRKQAGEVALRVYRTQSLFDPPPTNALADTFDFAVGFFPDVLALDARLRSAILWEDQNVCIVSASHPTIRRRLTLRHYTEAGHVAVFYKTEGPGLIDTLLAQQSLARRQTVLVPHFASVPYAVAASDLIATVPERLAMRYRHLKLRVFPAPIAIPPFRLTMLWHERREADPAHAWLHRVFVEAAAQLDLLSRSKQYV